MRISDWSSDVCSSDLLGAVGELARAREPRIERVEGPRSADRFQRVGEGEAAPAGRDLVTDDFPQIGAAAVGAALRVGVAGRAFLEHVRTVRGVGGRSEEHTSELQSLMRISYAVFCLKKNRPNRDGNIESRHTLQ